MKARITIERSFGPKRSFPGRVYPIYIVPVGSGFNDPDFYVNSAIRIHAIEYNGRVANR